MHITPPHLASDMIVFSHLRWEFVKQRPQHIIERFAKNRKVLFVEEPIDTDEEDYGTAIVFTPSENITVVQPKLYWNNFIEELGPLVQNFIEKLEIESPILWFYSPAFEKISEAIDHTLIVFDCMDELSAFKGASPELLRHEKNLLDKADVVFTGGKSLYESKRRFHQNVQCFPSSVESAHFKKALAKETQIPQDIARIKQDSRFEGLAGFYGVIDERMDLNLLDELATQKSHVAFIMIGPVVKIHEGELPQRENIFYLGNKSYDDLPRYLKAFDVAIMPFALNKSTQFISPTKTLEFMAALKPIVSTPIYDVKRDYSREVAIARTSDQFGAAIDKYLHESATQKKFREKLQRTVIKRTSWDRTVEAMTKILVETAQEKQEVNVFASAHRLPLLPLSLEKELLWKNSTLSL